MKYLIDMTNKVNDSRKSILVLANDMDSAFTAANEHYLGYKAISGVLLFPHSSMHLVTPEENFERVNAL